MQALYCWVEEELGEQLKNYCLEKKDKKARVVRRALKAYLGDNNEGIKSEGLGMESVVLEVPREQFA